MYRYPVILYSLFLILFPAISAEDDQGIYTDKVFDQRIKSVQLYKEGWNLSYPVIRLGSDEKLVLNFDLLGDNPETYDYTFIHCSKDWNKSDIFPNDYLEGFPENRLEDFKPSFNTTVNYFHYRLVFPNDRIKLLLSGNYILSVYPAGNPEKTVLTRRFMITEDVAPVGVTIHRPQMTSDNDASQQVDFTVSLEDNNLTDPYRNIYSFILQNGIWNKSKKNLKPDFFGNNELKYNSLSEKNIFPGGNEFRYFDIKSIRYKSEFVRQIDYQPPYYNVYLFPSDNREYKPYFYWQDFNGKYYIAVQEGRDPDTDADYVNVYFTLPSVYMLAGGNMYVSGALTDWSFNNDNRMIYNPDKGQYECTLLLKQGWYNYEYTFLKEGDNGDFLPGSEGSHYETENDYLILVYYRNPTDRYDRLIGTRIANTLNRLSY